MSHVLMLNMYCKLQMELNNVLLCCLPLSIAQRCSEPTKRIQAILGYSLPKTLSPGVASGILVTSCFLAALITQATATASLSCRNASCGFRIVAEPADWEIQRRLWGAFGICTAQLTFQKQGAWSCHHKSYKSARACKCNLHCCCLPAINSCIIHLSSLNFTWLRLWVKDESTLGFDPCQL